MLQGICMLALPIKLFFFLPHSSNLLLHLWNCTGASFGIQDTVQMNWWHTVPCPAAFIWSHLSPLHPELWPEVHVCAHSVLGLLGMSVFLWVSSAVTREIPQFSSITLRDVRAWDRKHWRSRDSCQCASLLLFYFWIFINVNLDICCVQCACFVTWSHPRGITGITQRCLDFDSLSMETPDAESH